MFFSAVFLVSTVYRLKNLINVVDHVVIMLLKYVKTWENADICNYMIILTIFYIKNFNIINILQFIIYLTNNPATTFLPSAVSAL